MGYEIKALSVEDIRQRIQQADASPDEVGIDILTECGFDADEARETVEAIAKAEQQEQAHAHLLQGVIDSLGVEVQS